MTLLWRKFLGLHWLLMINMVALIAWGVWAIYNASSFRESPILANLWRAQIQWAMIGMAVFGVAALVDYKWVRWGGWVLYGLGVLLFILAHFFGPVECSARAIGIWDGVLDGYLALLDSYLVLLTMVPALALVLGHLHLTVSPFRHPWVRIVAAGMVAGTSMYFVLSAIDLGTAVIVGIILVLMLMVASIPRLHLAVLFLVGVSILPLWYCFYLKPYQKARVETFIAMLANDRSQTPSGTYMTDKLQLAVGSAGLWGKGPLSSKVGGRSVHRTYYAVPEGVNDFIYSVIVEEFGAAGGLAQIAGVTFLLLQCMFVAYRARDELGRMLAVGVAAMLFACSILHMGMNVLMVPIMGQSLPFTSLGSVFLIGCMFSMGLVQSVWVHRHSAPLAETEGDGEEGRSDVSPVQARAESEA